MPNITLPDGSVGQFDTATNGADIAASIGKRLARDAVAVRVDGELYDLSRDIESDATVEIVTRDSDDGLELLRHDAAHVLAEAVKELQSGGVEAAGVGCDVSDPKSVGAAADEAEKNSGTVHVLCNNAGVSPVCEIDATTS